MLLRSQVARFLISARASLIWQHSVGVQCSLALLVNTVGATTFVIHFSDSVPIWDRLAHRLLLEQTKALAHGLKRSTRL